MGQNSLKLSPADAETRIGTFRQINTVFCILVDFEYFIGLFAAWDPHNNTFSIIYL